MHNHYTTETRLLLHHAQDLKRSMLGDKTIRHLSSYSGSAAEVKAMPGFSAGRGLVFPCSRYRRHVLYLIKPDNPPIVDDKPLGLEEVAVNTPGLLQLCEQLALTPIPLKPWPREALCLLMPATSSGACLGHKTVTWSRTWSQAQSKEWSDGRSDSQMVNKLSPSCRDTSDR